MVNATKGAAGSADTITIEAQLEARVAELQLIDEVFRANGVEPSDRDGGSRADLLVKLLTERSLAASKDAKDRAGSLQGQIDTLSEKILALDLRGTEDGGAVDIAILRLDELIAARASYAIVEEKLADVMAENDVLAKKFGKLERETKAEATREAKRLRAEKIRLPREPLDEELGDVIAGAEHVVLRFSDGDALIKAIAPIEIASGDMTGLHGRLTISRTIPISGDVQPNDLTHAWIVADGKPVARCEIPNGLRVGGGRSAQFPTGHLIF
jgi:hypothetical protein